MCGLVCSRYRRDARSLDEDEEMWFNDDEDDEEGEAVEKTRPEEDFPESYGKYMEAKKGECTSSLSVVFVYGEGAACWCRSPEMFVL